MISCMRQFVPYLFQILAVIIITYSLKPNIPPSTSYYYMIPVSQYTNTATTIHESLSGVYKPMFLSTNLPTNNKHHFDIPHGHEELYKLIAYSEGMILLLLISYCSFYDFENKPKQNEKPIRRKRMRDNNECEEEYCRSKPLKYAKTD